MASVRAAMKKSGHKGGKGHVRSMHIEPAAKAGTFTSRVHRSSGPGEPYMGGDEKPTIHPSISHLAKHVKATFGGEDTEPDAGDPNEATEGE